MDEYMKASLQEFVSQSVHILKARKKTKQTKKGFLFCVSECSILFCIHISFIVQLQIWNNKKAPFP